MRPTRLTSGTIVTAAAAAFISLAPAALAQVQTDVVVDDFENGVSNWTRNDKNKLTGGSVSLADIVPTAANNTARAAASKGAALLAFKSGQKSWASLSRPIDGSAWAKVGAQRLTFYLDAGGETPGVILQLRGRYKNTAGAPYEMTFSLPHPIRLDIARWRKVVIPLTDFKGPKGETLNQRIHGLYLLQFLQSGNWDSRFFTIDDIVVEGNGVPIAPPPVPTPTPVRTPAPTPTPVEGAPSAVKVGADFLRFSGPIRASGNATIVSAGAGNNTLPIDSSVSYRQYLALLRPRFVRLDAASLSTLTDSARPGFDFNRLQTAAARVRSVGAEPLVALRNPSEWGLDPRGYAAFATGAAGALNRKGQPVTRYFELAAVDASLDATAATEYYNAGYKALKGVSAAYRVGGHSVDATDVDAIRSLLEGAAGLDFLAVTYFGAQEGQPSDAALLQAAREVKPLKVAAGLLDKSKFRNAPLFVTGANLNSARNTGETTPSDIRTQSVISASWWAQFLASGSRLADQVFQNDSVNPEWGFMIPVGSEYRAYPAYYAIWLWNTYFPPGSQRVVASSSNQDVFVAACNTPTSHNLLVVNSTDQEQTAQIGIRGFPLLREARMRLFDDPQKTVSMTPLPKSPYQTIKLAPYAVAVVQFIEPPKKKR